MFFQRSVPRARRGSKLSYWRLIKTGLSADESFSFGLITAGPYVYAPVNLSTTDLVSDEPVHVCLHAFIMHPLVHLPNYVAGFLISSDFQGEFSSFHCYLITSFNTCLY